MKNRMLELKLLSEDVHLSQEDRNLLAQLEYACSQGVGVCPNQDAMQQCRSRLYEDEAVRKGWPGLSEAAREEMARPMRLELKSRDEDFPPEARKLLTELACACEEGIGVVRSYEAARRCLECLARLGDPWGLYRLGWLRQNGLGVKQDLKRAMQYYREAASHGQTDAMVSLGRIYEDGSLGEPDGVLAVYWYEQAAAKDDRNGMFNLANCLEQGWGVEQDRLRAKQLFEKLAGLGESSAYLYLGIYAEEGVGGPADVEKARAFYLAGVKQGDAFCCNQLGRMYGLGLGVKKDPAQALEWYRKGARLGDSLCFSNIAWFYESGELGAPDVKTAIRWYSAAAVRAEEEHALEALERLGVPEEQWSQQTALFYCPAVEDLIEAGCCARVASEEDGVEPREVCRDCSGCRPEEVY